MPRPPLLLLSASIIATLALGCTHEQPPATATDDPLSAHPSESSEDRRR
jgi:hypothetical protein